MDYLKGKLSDTAAGKSGRYFTDRGIKIKIADLNAFAAVVEAIFVDQDYASKRVGELSNYNMRQTLSLSQRVITSATLRIEDLIRSYVTGALVAPSVGRFMNALLKGDYEFFRPGDEAIIFPIFQIDPTVRQTPLIHVRILMLLRDKHKSAHEDVERYMHVTSVASYFDLAGISELAVQKAIEALLAAELIEPYDLTSKEYSDGQRVAVTYSGLAHLDLALFNPVFFEQMALTTRIPDSDMAAQIAGAYRSTRVMDARLEEVREIFCAYLLAEDGRLTSLPETPEFAAQARLPDDLRKQWMGGAPVVDPSRSAELAAEHVQVTVDRFDSAKGYGFVQVPSLRDDAFLHARILEQAGLGDVFDGDDLICDISSNEKGLFVSKVYEVNSKASPIYKGVVVKLMHDKSYGFMSISGLGVDAFFHYHVFPTTELARLAEGREFQVEIKTDSQGRSQVRRIIQ